MSDDPTQIDPQPRNALQAPTAPPTVPAPAELPALSAPAGPPAAAPAPESLPHVAGYTLLRQIGSGGMGTVWEAEQLSTRRLVALKLIGSAFSEKSRLRFDREVRLAASLEHPGIARVYDSGLHQGVCFYAMELVRGQPLDLYVREQHSSRQQILQLIAAACQAIEHAHQHGVIHRDLKPSNILVTPDAQPHILDFGLAKALVQDADQAITLDGDVSGTPAFMSPEQAAGQSGQADPRSDVYSLGVILYRLLTGKPPHDTTGPYPEILRRISRDDILRPRQADPTLDAELEAILLKALARDPAQRYARAGDLADDIDRYLRGEPLSAPVRTALYFWRKRLYRHRKPLAIVTAILMLLASIAIFAQDRIHKARRQSDLMSADKLISDGDRHSNAQEWDDARKAYEAAATTLAKWQQPTFAAQLGLWHIGREAPSPLLTVTGGKDEDLVDAIFFPDMRTLYCSLTGGRVEARDAITGRVQYQVAAHFGRVAALAVSPDGRLLLTGGDDRTMKLWDAATGRHQASFDGFDQGIQRIVFAPDSRRALSISGDPLGSGSYKLAIWDLVAKSHTDLKDPGGRIADAAFSPDGSQLLTAGEAIILWDLATASPRRTLKGHKADVTAIAFLPDGHWFLSGGTDCAILLWDIAKNTPVRTYTGQEQPIRAVAASRSGTVLAIDEDGVIRLWDRDSGEELRAFGTHRAELLNAAFSPDARVAVTVKKDEGLSLWALSAQPELRPIAQLAGSIARARFVAGGSVAMLSTARECVLADVPGGIRLSAWPSAGAAAADISTDGQRLAVAQRSAVTLLDALTGSAQNTVPFSARRNKPALLALSPDGRNMAISDADKTLKLFSADTGQLVASFALAEPQAGTITFSPDGKLMAIADGNAVRLVTLADGSSRLLTGHGGAIAALSFSPTGRYLASAGGGSAAGQFSPQPGADDFAIRLWTIADNRESRPFPGHTARVRAVCFSPDERILASAAEDHTLRLWSLDPARELRALRSPRSFVTAIAFSPDGQSLITGGDDGHSFLWDLASVDRLRAMQPDLTAARSRALTGQMRPGDWTTLGQWYAMHHLWDWAATCLESAHSAGDTVDPLLLARCYCLTDRPSLAAEQLARIAPPTLHLQLWQRMLRDTPTTTPSRKQ